MTKKIDVKFHYYLRASSVDLTVDAEVAMPGRDVWFRRIHVAADARLVLDTEILVEEHAPLAAALTAEAIKTAELWCDPAMRPEAIEDEMPLDATERAVFAKIGKENDEMCDQIFDLRKERDELQEQLAAMALENAHLKSRAA